MSNPRGLSTRLGWAAVVGLGMLMVVWGLAKLFYIVATEEALNEARTGERLIGVGCLVLAAAATWMWSVGGGRAAALLVAVPVLVCGGSTLLAEGTLFPQISLLLAGPAAFAGVALGVTVRRPRGHG